MVAVDYPASVLSDRTLHGVIWRTGVRRKGLGFNLCVAPPQDCIVPDFRVMEFTEVFQSIPEKTGRLEVCEEGCTKLIYQLILSYMIRSYKY